MSKVQRLVSTVQDHYPERLEKALLLRAPLIFASAWAVIKGFIDPVTAAKVRFVTSNSEAETTALKEAGAYEVVPSSYGGGNDELLPVPNVPGEPNVPGAPALHTPRAGS